ALATPFVEAVVAAAKRNHCFIDKTIGDEVMLFMPSIGLDVALANIGLGVRDSWPLNVSTLVSDLLKLISERVPGRTFSAGFGFGPVTLRRVGTEAYSEWTIYGNAVNAAKRIQALAGEMTRDKKTNALAVSAIEDERGEWFRKEFDFSI